MNTILTIIYGTVMAIIGFVIGLHKAEKKNEKQEYDKGWLDCDKYYQKNYHLIPIPEMLDDLYDEYNAYENEEKPNPVEFLQDFENFLDTVPDENPEPFTGNIKLSGDTKELLNL